MKENKLCINQKVHLVGNDMGQLMGDVHSESKPYRVIADYGTDWGVWNMCDECKNKKLALGWQCISEEKI